TLDVPLLWIDRLHEQVGEIAARFHERPSESMCMINVLPLVPVTPIMHIDSRFHERPSESMCMIGVTGTNGKTSCVQLLAQALTLLGHRAASIGTLGAGVHG